MAHDRTLVAGTGLPRRRLDPFAFPAETNVRFTLLVVAALALAFRLGLLVAFDVVNPDDVGAASLSPTQDDEQFFSEDNRAILQREFVQSVAVVCLPGMFLFALLGLSIAIFRTHPSRIRRQKSLQPVTRETSPALYEAVADLAEMAGVTPMPALETGRNSKTVDGQAFGVPKRPVLRLGGRLGLALRKTPDRFRAVILHELAHVANRDVGRTYFAQALWTAVIVAVVIPALLFFVFIFFQGIVAELLSGAIDFAELLTVNLPAFLFAIFQFGVTLAVVATIRGSLLRVREMYADWRAAQWGAEAPLMAILRGNAAQDHEGWWARLWRLHPPAAERLRVLQDSSRLFELRLDLPLLTGILLAQLLSGLIFFLLSASVGIIGSTQAAAFDLGTTGAEQEAFGPLLLAMALMTASTIVMSLLALVSMGGAVYLVAGTVGLQVQRQTIVEMIEGRGGIASYLRLLPPALLIVAGMEVGNLITPFSILSPRSLVAWLWLIPWWVGLTVLIWLALAFTRFYAKRWLGGHTGGSPPKVRRALLTLALTVILLGIFSAFVLIRLEIVEPFSGILQVPSAQIVFVALGAALLVCGITFVGVGVVVLLSRLGRRRCPNCGEATRHRRVVGELCEHCGQDLGGWLFADPPARPPYTEATLVSGG